MKYRDERWEITADGKTEPIYVPVEVRASPPEREEDEVVHITYTMLAQLLTRLGCQKVEEDQ